MVVRRVGRKTVLAMLRQQQVGRPSTINPASSTRGASLTTCSAGPLRPSASLHYPRWVNSKQEPNEKPEEKEEEEEKPSKEQPQKRKPSKAPESRASSSAPSSASAGSSSHSGSGGSKPASSGSTDVAKQSVPEEYPQVLALPITRRPLFPGFYKAVVIRDPAVVAAIKETTKRGQPYLGAFLLKDDNSTSDVITDIDAVHPVGVFAQITSTFTSGPPGKDGQEGGGDLTVVLYPHRRIKITELLPPNSKRARQDIHEGAATAENERLTKPEAGQPSQQDGFPDADVVTSFESSELSAEQIEAQDPEREEVEEDAYRPLSLQSAFLQDFAVSRVNVDNVPVEPFDHSDAIIRAVSQEIISVFKDIAGLNAIFRDQIANFSMSVGSHNVFEEPEKLADFSAAMSSAEANDLQEILEATHVADRLQKSLLLLKKELMNAQLQNKISKDVDQKIAKRQREYYLMEQLKGIKKELGMESDGKDKLVEKFMDKIKTLNMPESVRKVFDEELSKLQTLEPAASEFNITRNYRRSDFS